MSSGTTGGTTTTISLKYPLIIICTTLTATVAAYYGFMDEAGNPNAGAVVMSLVLGIFASLLTTWLWKHPSGPDHIGVEETCIALGLLAVGALAGATILQDPIGNLLGKLKLSPTEVRPILAPQPETDFSYEESTKTLTLEPPPQGRVWVAKLPAQTKRGKKIPARQFFLDRPENGVVQGITPDTIIFFQSTSDSRTSSGVPVLYGETEEEEQADPQSAS